MPSGSKLENHRRDDEWVLVVETCHQCECHRQEWLHHDAQDYRPGNKQWNLHSHHPRCLAVVSVFDLVVSLSMKFPHNCQKNWVIL